MCYSASSSFGTFFFVLIICCILWLRGSTVQKSLSIILAFVALMQVIEGLLWLNLECNNANKIITSFIPLLLFLQPIIIIGTLYYFKAGVLSPVIYKLLLCISFILLPLYIVWIKDNVGKCTTVGENGHLVWPFTKVNPHPLVAIFYFLTITIGIASLKTEWYGLLYMFIALLGLSKSMSTYGHSWGSIWCHFVNFLAIGALFV